MHSLGMDFVEIDGELVGTIRGTAFTTSIKITSIGRDFFTVYWALIALARQP